MHLLQTNEGKDGLRINTHRRAKTYSNYKHSQLDLCLTITVLLVLGGCKVVLTPVTDRMNCP